ncbi:MAG: sigma 54-interacting transcriptional regulator, partial [Pyrinomonadaceae bacterium]
MRADTLEFISRSAKALADAAGMRSGSAVVIEQLTEVLSAQIAFIVMSKTDGEIADVIAASGLGVADFRRVEERIAKSSLWKIFDLSSPFVIDDLAEDPVLNFIAFGTGSRLMAAFPIVLGGTTSGFVAVAFPARSTVDEVSVIRILKAVAALFAQALRVERLVAEESRKLAEENIHLKQELKAKYDFGQLIGNSSPMRQIYDQVRQVATSNAIVLLRGESGTGKELIANSIHYNSLRSKRPFIKVNCAALPENLIEAELFGAEPGAIAGESKRKKGRIEFADGGTLFLDEVADLPLQTQAKLLSVIEEREFERLGGNEPIKINIRLIAATGKDLENEITAGRFSEVLFYRLNGFTIFMPPLRERKSDILLLAEHFLEKFELEHKKAVRRISTPAIDMLTAYHYPGNVRELENAIERAVIVCDSNVIHGHHLPPTLQTAEVSGTETRVTFTSAVEAFESDLIQDTLKSTRGNIAKAALMLDSTERILGYKIKKYS